MSALLRAANVETVEFDSAAGGLWRAIIPLRLMIDEGDLANARRVLWEGGFLEARDGDWDLKDQPGKTKDV